MASSGRDSLLHAHGVTDRDSARETFWEDENMGVPVDRGYSWVIAVCAFLHNTFTMGHNRALSALFIDVSEEFSASTTVTSLTFTFFALAISVSALLSSTILLGRWKVRTICVVAGFLNALTTCFISHAPNVIVWLSLYFVKGFFFGALLLPPIALIGHYFKRRRSLASSIASIGIVMAYIVFPPLASFLRLQFGLRGAMLIIGALEMHVVPIGMLFRPLSLYKKAYKRKRGRALRDMQMDRTKGEEKQLIHSIESLTSKIKLDLNPTISVDTTELESVPRGRTFSLGNRHLPVTFDRSISQPASTIQDFERQLRAINKKDGAKVAHTSSMTSVNLGASIAGSMLDVMPVDVHIAAEDDDDSDDETTGKKSRRPISCSVSTFIDTSLLKLWTLRMFIAYSSISALTNFVLVYMPAIAYKVGIPKTDAAFLLTIAGCMDLVVRISVGFIADKNWVSKENLIAGSLSVIVVITQFARFYTTYSLFVMFALLAGIFSGFRQNLFNPMMLDYFGPEKAPRAMGICTMGLLLMVSANHPVQGALVDATGDFTAALHYAGAAVFISILILLSHPICKRWDEENRKKAEEAGKLKDSDLTITQP